MGWGAAVTGSRSALHGAGAVESFRFHSKPPNCPHLRAKSLIVSKGCTSPGPTTQSHANRDFPWFDEYPRFCGAQSRLAVSAGKKDRFRGSSGPSVSGNPKTVSPERGQERQIENVRAVANESSGLTVFCGAYGGQFVCKRKRRNRSKTSSKLPIPIGDLPKSKAAQANSRFVAFSTNYRCANATRCENRFLPTEKGPSAT